MYCEDLESGRLSVVVPVGRSQAGTSSVPMLIKFMCLGSDVGGINRRALRLIFTLEDEETHVLGRQVVDVKAVDQAINRSKLSIDSGPGLDGVARQRLHVEVESQSRRLG